MDYGQLAQLSSPGQSPLTSGIVDPLGYQRWQNLNAINQGAIKNSIPLAQTSAQMEQQKAKEFMLGAPGREDTISLVGKKAEAALKDFPEQQVREKLLKELEDDETRRKLSDYTADIAGEADAYVNAPDENSKQTILRSIQGKTIRMGPGKTHTFGTDPEKDKTLLMAGGMARASKPELMSKEKIASAKNETAIVLKAMTEAGLDVRQAAKLSSAEAVAKIRLSEKDKPLSDKQALVAYLDKMYGNDPATWLQEYSKFVQMNNAGIIKFGQEAALLGGFKKPDGSPKFPVEPPQPYTPAPATRPPSAPVAAPTQQPPKFEVGKVYVDGKGNKAKFTANGWEPVK